ncbi:MAG: MoaD/ThiS family protein [Pirellulales bacterium]
MAQVQLPANLRMLLGQYGTLEIDGTTVGDILRRLVIDFPELRPQLFKEGEQLHSYVNIFIDQQNIRELHHLETLIEPHSKLLILTALAGG